MSKMKAKIADFSIDILTRKQKLTLALDGDFRAKFDELKDKELEVTVKPWREKRSLNANAYCWKLIGQLAEALNLPACDIYRHAIKQVGIYRDVELAKDAAETIKHIWKTHGIGWIAEQVDETEKGVSIRLYYGSSSYNTKQMSRLIDYVVADCKEMGIETMTPAELALLIEDWKKEKKE